MKSRASSFNLKKFYLQQPGNRATDDGEDRRNIQTAAGRLQEDILAIMNTNNAVRIMNEPITSTLQNVTGQDFGSDREAWRRVVDRSARIQVRPSGTGPQTDPRSV